MKKNIICINNIAQWEIKNVIHNTWILTILSWADIVILLLKYIIFMYFILRIAEHFLLIWSAISTILLKKCPFFFIFLDACFALIFMFLCPNTTHIPSIFTIFVLCPRHCTAMTLAVFISKSYSIYTRVNWK